jgi:pimeloyl-ACP methyl ester carboxylesterase
LRGKRPPHEGVEPLPGLLPEIGLATRPTSCRQVDYVIVLVGLTAAILSQIASAQDTTSSNKHSSDPKPTIVLVHGAWADASSWSPVTKQLQREGYQVLVPPNPLRSLSGDAAYLSAFLRDRTSGPVVLVGHSYGGAVITDAGASDPDVKALVYIDAFVPDQSESVLDLASAKPGSDLAGDPTTVFDFVSYPGAPQGDADLYVKLAIIYPPAAPIS